MRKFVPWVLSPLVLAISMSAAAASGDLLSPAMRATMQRDLNMTTAQLSQYLAVERLAARQRAAVAKSQGEHYAGSWIERKANGDYEFVVATTAPSAKGAPSGITVRNARHTLAQLKASKDELDLHASRSGSVPAGVYAWGVDVQTNAVTLDVNRQSVTVERGEVELVADKPRKWSVVRWNAGDDEANRASQANLGPTYGVCPNCRGRANLALDDTQRKCPVCELLFEIDWGSEC